VEFISDFFVNVSAFFQSIWDWMYVGIYDFAKEVMVYLTKVSMYTWIQIQLFAIDVALQVVQDIFVDLGVTLQVQNAWNMVPENMRNTLTFFGIPQALTIIVTAIPARIAMRFIPFIGR
jgi:hypothetical protein